MHNQTFGFVDGAASDLNIAEEVGKSILQVGLPFISYIQQLLLIKIRAHYSHLAVTFKVNAAKIDWELLTPGDNLIWSRDGTKRESASAPSARVECVFSVLHWAGALNVVHAASSRWKLPWGRANKVMDIVASFRNAWDTPEVTNPLFFFIPLCARHIDLNTYTPFYMYIYMHVSYLIGA